MLSQSKQADKCNYCIWQTCTNLTVYNQEGAHIITVLIRVRREMSTHACLCLALLAGLMWEEPEKTKEDADETHLDVIPLKRLSGTGLDWT